jgi:uncharacterized protein (TIGR00369 family)
MLAMTAEDLAKFLDEHFPQIEHLELDIDRVEVDGVRVSVPFNEMHLRPGGTVSGPTLVWIADVVLYLCILSRIGPVAMAVTTNINVNFLRLPSQSDIVAEGRLLKLGRRLAVGEVTLYSEGEEDPVAHATGTYSLPPRDEPEEPPASA